ncbi:helix-turn-helix domain-containing protein [Salinifilum ghardaiensis]
MPGTSPTLAAWELGIRLRQAREATGMTGTEVAENIGISQNHVSNTENGRRLLAEDKLHRIAEIYGIGEEERAHLDELRRASEVQGWWQQYRRILAPDFLRFLGYEHGAAEVRTYESALVSGLLQSEDYARAVHQGDTANLRQSEVDRRVEVRRRRKQRLLDGDPLYAQVVMAEATLHQQVGGAEVLAGQLRHLLELVESCAENLDLRILPFTAPCCAAMGGATFHLLAFPSTELPLVAWDETSVSMGLIHDQARVQQYRTVFVEAQARALDRDSSAELIRGRLAALG